jgi:putative drug exporter of the RND superfamily
VLQRLARTMYRRRRRVVTGWVVLLIGLVALNASAGGEFLDEFSLPGSESRQAVDFLESHGFENRAGSGGQVVFQTDQGVQDAAVQQAMEGLFARFEADIPDAQVVSPYTPEGSRQISTRDPRIAYAQVNLGDRDQKAYQQAGETARGRAGLDEESIEALFMTTFRTPAQEDIA